MKKKGILAVDVGSSSIRATVYIKDEGVNKQLAVSNKGEARFSAEALWGRLATLIKSLTKDEKNINYEAVGVSAFLGWVVVDQFGVPVEKAWSWMAHGNEEEVKKFEMFLPEDAPQIIGRKINEELGVFRWGRILRQAEKNYMVLSLKDYLNFKLTGVMKMDRTHASYTGLFSIKQKKWDSRLLKAFRIDASSLPPLSYGYEEVGNITPEIALDLGLQLKTKVIAGGPDGTLAILGGGGTRAGKTIEVMGTTDVLFHLSDNKDTEKIVEKGLVRNCYIFPDLYAIGGPTGMTGGTLTWLMENWNWTFESKSFQQLLHSWASITPAEEGLFVIPFLTGARVPDWSPAIRGSIVGLTPSHTFKDIYKATVEGIAFGTKDIFEQLESITGVIDTLIAIGGGARNESFLLTRAASIGCRIVIPKEIEASTFGVIALAGTLVHWFDDIHSAVASLNPISGEIKTSAEEIEQYKRGYKQYKQLLTILNTWYNR
ncbi:FGGY-family carbohydrate kinase [Alkalihalobacillus oceani]|uniref:xylulokinase n=1 Tax=Halalkalibacter oceani TaxID=1653776 RepID=UPI0020411761|nr:FGGY-family carbohydrate kinase [Halalkalibacter oceani]MCM3763254.1 FGGY-family carbohydrate kinase [Halalkalibacter oceani]